MFLLACPATAAAQTASDVRAAVALRATPVAAFTPMMTPASIGRRITGAQFALRYGLAEASGLQTHSVAVGTLFELGSNSSVALSAGASDAECEGCNPALLLGLGADMRVFEAGDFAGPGSSLLISVSGEIGYAQLKPGDNTALSLGVGAPIALTFTTNGATGMRVVPYVTPVFGIGQISGTCAPGACERSGSRVVLGGGVGVWNPLTSISASVGVSHVMIDGGRPVYGVNVIFGGR